MQLFLRPRLGRGTLFLSLIFIAAVFAAGAMLINSAAAAAQPADLFDDAGHADRQVETFSEPGTMRERLVTIDLDQLGRNRRQSLQLNLFDDTVVSAVHQRHDYYQNNQYVWVGHDPRDPLSDVALSVNGSIVHGTVNVAGELYQIEHVAGTTHRIKQMAPNANFGLPPLLPDDSIVIAPKPESRTVSAPADEAERVDLLVLYTPRAKAAAGGTAATEALINLALSETNTGYQESGINFELNLVHQQEINYYERGSGASGDTYFENALYDVTSNGDGAIDEVHDLRNQYQADLVALIIERREGSYICGLAYLIQNGQSNPDAYGFSVTHRTCATGYYSFGHEVGHNMGSAHNVENAGIPGMFPYSYGYQSPSNSFRTVMAYNCPNGGCPRVNRWSNPALTYNGQTTGLENAADNSRSLNNSVVSVANFRQGDPLYEPTATPTITPSPTNTPTPTNTPSPTPTPTNTPSPTPLPTQELDLDPNQQGQIDTADTSIRFPTNTFAEVVTILYEALDASALPAPPPEEMAATHYQFSLTAETADNRSVRPIAGRRFRIDLYYSIEGLNLVKQHTIGLYYWDPVLNEWIREPSNDHDIDMKHITASGEAVTVWALFGEEPEQIFLPLIRSDLD